MAAIHLLERFCHCYDILSPALNEHCLAAAHVACFFLNHQISLFPIRQIQSPKLLHSESIEALSTAPSSQRSMNENEDVADEVDSEDEWYARMEAAAASRHDEEEEQEKVYVAQTTSSALPVLVTEEEYYNSIQDYNCSVSNEAFASESDTIWHSLMKSVVKSSTAAPPPKGQLIRVMPSDSASILLAQQWAFGYLPQSSKVYMELGLFGASADEFYHMYTDDLVHPTLVAMITIKDAVHRIEVSMFSPYTATETAFPALFQTIEAVKTQSGLSDVVFCGAGSAHYEQTLSKNIRWREEWTEVCGMYVYEDHVPPEAGCVAGGEYTVTNLT